MLSKEALDLLKALFDKKSNLQLPIGVAEQIIEIREWLKEQSKEK